MDKDGIVREYEYVDVDNYERIEESMQVTMEDVYDQTMVFHIILLLGRLEHIDVTSNVLCCFFL